MSRLPDVSVVISTHNRRDTLARTLDSLVRQRVPASIRYEVIVVDNACTDGTRELIADYIRQFPGIVRYAFEERAGVSNGRNAGIRAARAPIVAFTDDDNVAARTWVETVVRLLHSHPEAAGAGGPIIPEWPDTPPRWLDRRHWSPLAILDYGERMFHTGQRRPLCLLTANLAVRRDVLVRAGGFSAEFTRCQDHELLLRLWRDGYRILYAPELVTFAPIDPARMSKRYHRQWHQRRGRYAAQMRLEEAIDEQGFLRDRPIQTPRLFGTPGFVYADLWTHAKAWTTAAIRRDAARAAHHEHRVRYLVAYVCHTARLSRRSGMPIVRDSVRFVARQLGRRAEQLNMSAARLVLAHLVVAFILAGSAYDIATGTEHWPLSPYPMFSTVQTTRTLDSLLLRGVAADGSDREIPLREAGMIAPFDQCRLTTAMARVANQPDGQARLQTMLDDCLGRYEQARERGEHDGPPLQSIRLYDAHWELDPDARNVDNPEQVTLVGQAQSGSRGESASARR
jgi:glycosyltransferase involved in cell wall biosynthesis